MIDRLRMKPGSARDISLVEPLWRDLHDHHARVMPELEPYVSGDESWEVRRSHYATLMAKPGTALVLAYVGDDLVGYGLAHVMPAEETWLADTWATGSRIGEIESLSIRPGYRGHGIGSAVLEQLEDHLADEGVDCTIIGALAGNRRALDLYEKRGYRRTWLYLSRRRPEAVD